MTDQELNALGSEHRGAFLEKLKRLRNRGPGSAEAIEHERRRAAARSHESARITHNSSRLWFERATDAVEEAGSAVASQPDRRMTVAAFLDSVESHVAGDLDVFTAGCLSRWATGRESVLGTILDALVQAHAPSLGPPTVSQVSEAVRRVYGADAGRILQVVHR